MNQESIYLLKALRSFVTGEDPGVFNGDGERLMELARIHSVQGVLGHTAMVFRQAFPAQMQGVLRRWCLNTIAEQSDRGQRTEALIEKLNENGIDHLLFKGYVVRDCYPVPELRTYNDIDLLIHPADRQKSDALMISLGFARKTDWEPVYGYYRGNEYYEIHTDVMEVDVSDRADYRGYFAGIWDHARRSGGHSWFLTAEYHFLYLLTHMAKHITGSGAGIRMYLDIALFLQRWGAEMDWAAVRRELDRLCLADFANVVLTVVHRFFGAESPIALRPVAEEVVADFMEFTMAGGTFGHVGRDPGVLAMKGRSGDAENVSRTAAFAERLFPPVKQMEKRYTYLQDRPWLLPAAWVHRVFRNRDAWGRRAKEAERIFAADPEEARRLRRIYREIGL